MVLSKKFIIAKHFDGEPKSSDLVLVEELLPYLKLGGEKVVNFLFGKDLKFSSIR